MLIGIRRPFLGISADVAIMVYFVGDITAHLRVISGALVLRSFFCCLQQELSSCR